MFTLVLPALLRPSDEILPPLKTPALNDLLRFARFHAASCTRSQLYRAFLCNDLTLPENTVFVSPIVQQMGMNSVSWQDAVSANITLTEAQTWCAGLTEFYAGKWIFQAKRADLWTLTLPEKPSWHAPCVLDVTNVLDSTLLVSGEASQWLQASTEIQMWLHAHSLNATRCNTGLPPINGVWLWNAPNDDVSLQDTSLLGSNSTWVSQNRPHIVPMSETWADWQNICALHYFSPDDSIIFNETLRHTLDAYLYTETLLSYEEKWFAPMRNALFSGSLNGICLVCEAGSWQISPRAHWAFWRRKVAFNGKAITRFQAA